MQPKTSQGPAITILVATALLIGYLLGGFIMMVVLIVGGAAWWTVLTFAIAGLMAILAWLWLWKRRSTWAG